ncbi:MAG: c-type cytochrome [Polaromonas sp.]|nr:c-type cytochrome [Polaromonas sp.]
MSANDPTTAHEEDHSGPIKTPKQLLLAVFFSFMVPVFAIIALVYYVSSDNKPAAGTGDLEKAVAQRIQKIGMVEIRDANRPLKAGNEVYAAQCAACHATGAAGAPKFGDAAAWAPRIKTGFEALWNSALKGKNAMGPQGGGDFDDVEIGKAVVHMANAAGAKFAEPQKAAATADAGAAAAPAAPAAPVAAPAVAAAAPVVVAAAAPAAASKAGTGEALYKQACIACHASGVAGAPKFGDKAAWAPRIQTGLDMLTASVVKGKNAMPPKGGSSASDADIRAAVEYMVSAAK